MLSDHFTTGIKNGDLDTTVTGNLFVLFLANPEVRYLYYNYTHEENCTRHFISSDDMKAISEAKLNHQSVRVGLLFASKSAIQLLVNPLVGPLTNR